MRATVLTLFIIAAGCETTEPPVASHVELRSETSTFTSLRQTTQLGAIVYDQWGSTMRNVPVEWSTSAPSVISVDGSGLATAQGVGGAVVEAAVDKAVGRLPMSVNLGPTRVVVRDGTGFTRRVGTDVEVVTAQLENLGNPGAYQIQAMGLPTELGQKDVVFATLKGDSVDAEWQKAIEWTVNTDGRGTGPRVRYLRVWSRTRGGQRYEVTDTYTLDAQ